MKVKVDRKVCIGCGLCNSLAESLFDMKSGKSQPKVDDLQNTTDERLAKEAKDACPVGAISIT